MRVTAANNSTKALGANCKSECGRFLSPVNPQSRRQIFETLRAGNPRPTTELRYGNRYQLLVAVVLSAQATDKSVNAATRDIFAEIKTPRQMIELGEARLAERIKTIGLFRNKARNVVALSQILAGGHRGRVPKTRAELEALPGVGRKTANVVLNTAFGEPTIAVDTHIFRVANRIGLARAKNERGVEDILVAETPPEFARNAHHWLILHGRYVCRAKAPRCLQCPIRDWCEWPQKS